MDGSPIGSAEAKGGVVSIFSKKTDELAKQWTVDNRIEDAKLALAESKTFGVLEQDLVAELADVPARIPDSGGVLESATREIPFENSLGMRFVPVPIIGGPSGGRKVLFSVWETRVGDYQEFADANPNHVWPEPGFDQNDQHPASMVSGEDAIAFCAWLTEKEQKEGRIGENEVYRLPTDREWSCAVGLANVEDPELGPMGNHRKATIYPWGADWPPPRGAGNYGEAIEGFNDGYERTAPVGKFEPSDTGLYDLGGNVWEWVSDWLTTPGSRRLMRGGSFRDSNPLNLLSTDRNSNRPGFRLGGIGFRCVLAEK